MRRGRGKDRCIIKGLAGEYRKRHGHNLFLSGVCLTIFGGLSSVTAVVFSTTAMAQDRSRGVLEDIVITARRYEESLQDAPLSVNVMDAGYLEAQGIQTVSDVIEFTPGATYVRFNQYQDEYSIRGISSQSSGASGDSSFQTVVDDVVVSKGFMKNPAMFDIERIEVLRGPQGTSFGRNASAGMLHIVTKRPTREFEGGLTLDGGSHESIGVEGFVSGPISEKVSGRVAFNFDQFDGYTESISTGDGLDGRENFAFRGSLLLEPTSAISIYLKAEYSEDNDETPVRRSSDCTFPTIDGTGATAPVPPHPAWPIVFTDPCNVWKTEISDGFDFFFKREIINLTSEIVWDTDWGFALTSVTGYLDGKIDYFQEASGTPVNAFFQEVNSDAWMFSQEFRIDNHGSGERLRWLAGIYYLRDDQFRFDDDQQFVDNTFGRVPTFNTRITSNDTKSIGVFGEITYDVTDRLRATFGVRWSRDEKEGEITRQVSGFAGPIDGIAGCIFNPGPPFDPATNFNCGDRDNPLSFGPIPQSDSWEDVSFKGSVEYHINDAHMLYALISQGYKSGGFQLEPPTESDARISFDEETATNYEIGFKGTFRQRLQINISGYLLQYDDLQLNNFQQTGTGGFVLRTVNAAGVDVLGVELEAVAQISEYFRVSGSYARTNSELDNTVLILDTAIGPIDLDGTRPDNAPKWTGTFVAQYDIPINNGSVVILRGDWRGRSAVFDDLGEQILRKRPTTHIFGARATWVSTSGGISLSAWGKNLTKEKDIVNIGPVAVSTIQFPVAFGAPRTWGLTANFRF